MTDEAVDGPSQRLRASPDRAAHVGRHAERRHARVVAPQHEADFLADDRVDVADDGLRDEVAVEQRLRNPRRRVVGLVHEVEKRLPALRLGSRVVGVPLVHDMPQVRRETGRERVTRDGRGRRTRRAQNDDQSDREAKRERNDVDRANAEHRFHLLPIRRLEQRLHFVRAGRILSWRQRRIGLSVLVERARAVAGQIGQLAQLLVHPSTEPVARRAGQRGTSSRRPAATSFSATSAAP